MVPFDILCLCCIRSMDELYWMMTQVIEGNILFVSWPIYMPFINTCGVMNNRETTDHVCDNNILEDNMGLCVFSGGQLDGWDNIRYVWKLKGPTMKQNNGNLHCEKAILWGIKNHNSCMYVYFKNETRDITSCFVMQLTFVVTKSDTGDTGSQ